MTWCCGCKYFDMSSAIVLDDIEWHGTCIFNVPRRVEAHGTCREFKRRTN